MFFFKLVWRNYAPIKMRNISEKVPCDEFMRNFFPQGYGRLHMVYIGSHQLRFYTHQHFRTYCNWIQVPKIRISDPNWFNADPDTDQDPAFFPIADPDPGSGSRVWWPKIWKKIYSFKTFNIFLIKNCNLLTPRPP